MYRIYADFNSQDELGRIDLHTVGSQRDLEKLSDCLTPGLRVVLYFDDVEVDAVLEYDQMFRRWFGVVPDWSAYRDLNQADVVGNSVRTR